MSATYDVPDGFDVNSLKQILILIENLKIAGVKTFTHPSGLALTLDTQRRPDVAPAPSDGYPF